MNHQSIVAWNRRQVLMAGLSGAIAIRFQIDGTWKGVACGQNASIETARAFEVQFPAMGSLLTLRWLDNQSQSIDHGNALATKVRQRSIEIAEHWNMVMSDYEEESEAMRIAVAAEDGNWHSVSQDLRRVIDSCDYWNRLSKGAFDASLGAMTRLRRRRNLPSRSQWEEAMAKTGWSHLDWDSVGSRLRVKKVGLRFDFGAIGKGWVADEIFESMKTDGLDCCSVDFAGNMRLGNAPPETTGWPISIDRCELPRDPQNRESPGTELCRLRLSNCGISTSGDRWQRLPDARSSSKSDTSSHILDPNRVEGIDQVQNVTIISNNATSADAASTATSVWQVRNLSDWLAILTNEPGEYRWILQAIKNNQLHLNTKL